MQITTQRARPVSPAFDSYETRENRTENDSKTSKRCRVVVLLWEGCRVPDIASVLKVGGDVRKKDQKNLRSKPVD